MRFYRVGQFFVGNEKNLKTSLMLISFLEWGFVPGTLFGKIGRKLYVLISNS